MCYSLIISSFSPCSCSCYKHTVELTASACGRRSATLTASTAAWSLSANSAAISPVHPPSLLQICRYVNDSSVVQNIKNSSFFFSLFFSFLFAPLLPTFPPQQLLIDTYTQSDNADLVNYAALERVVGEQSTTRTPEKKFATSSHLQRPTTADQPGAKPQTSKVDTEELLERLRIAFFKTRIRPVEFFRDYDRLNCSRISKHQFESGLALACSMPGGLLLNRAEIKALLEKFAAGPDSVNYRSFCETTDRGQSVARPTYLPRASLMRPKSTLVFSPSLSSSLNPTASLSHTARARSVAGPAGRARGTEPGCRRARQQ